MFLRRRKLLRRFNLSGYNLRLLKVKFGEYFISGLVITAVLGIVASIILFLWYSKDIPVPDKIKRSEGFSTMVLDRNEKPLYDIYSDKNRIPVPLEEMPDYLKKATIAIEDKDFYKHQGFDPKGIFRAMFRIITFQGIQGGSTLTQQLVKNVLLTQERSIPRKIKEFILAVQIERKYKKDEILQMYLNEAPYGGTMWGIESAAKGYFGKHTKDLDIIESVVLAGLPQRPSYYSPFSDNSKAYIKRAEEVLRRMREDGYISAVSEAEMKRQLPNVKFASPSSQFLAPHFVMFVKKQLIEKFGEKAVEAGGFKVITTVDANLQMSAEKIVREEMEKLKGLNASNSAVLVTDPKTGAILAYIGSRDYESDDVKVQGKFDVVSMGYRQPGSALKPITYAAALSKNYTASSVLMDVETHFPGGKEKEDYVPKNYDNKFRGPVQLRTALANSINIPAVKLTALVGIKEILKTSYAMGLATLEPTDANVSRLGLSLTLGGGEVRLYDIAESYGVFATQGIKNDLYSIEKVSDLEGKVLYEHKKTEGKKVMDSDIAFIISDILSDNNARKEVFGTNSYLYIAGKTVAAKTGTTDDKKDNWTVGYSPSVVVGVWVGNNDNSPMNPKLASGTTGAAPIWNRIFKEALKDRKDEPFIKSDNVIQMDIDAFAGGLPKDGKPTRKEYFIKGTEPTDVSPIYQKVKLSKSDNSKLANAVEIAGGSYDEKDFIVLKEDDPTSRDDKNRWQEGIDAWIKNQSDPTFKYPTETSNNNDNSVVVRIKKPENKIKTDTNDIEIIADAKAIRTIKYMQILVDGSEKKRIDGDAFSETLHIDTGIRTIKVKATDENGNVGESEIVIGVKTDPDPSQTPKPEPSKTPVPSPATT